MSMGLKGLGALVGLALLVVACNERVVYVTPSPEPDVPTLTEQAVVGLVSAACGEPVMARDIASGGRATYRGKGVWAVEYNLGRTSTQWEVYEASAAVAPIGTSWVHMACQRGPSE